MHTTIYAVTRLILFGFGWAIAAVLAAIAELMVAGTTWPIFALFAGWWTYACAVYIQGEAANSAARTGTVLLRGQQFDS